MTASGGVSAAGGEWVGHAVVLALCGGMIVAALLLSPDPGDSPVHLWGVALPEVCLLKATTGVPCPGCGLTHSFVALAHGDLAASLRAHRLGWLVFLYVVLQAVRHLVWLALPAVRARLERRARWLDRGVVVLAVLLLANWVVTLAG